MTPVSERILCGWAIASVRNLRGLSQGQLAEAAGLSAQTLWRIENGRRTVDIEELKRIAAALEWDVSWLMMPPVPSTVDLGPSFDPDDRPTHTAALAIPPRPPANLPPALTAA